MSPILTSVVVPRATPARNLVTGVLGRALKNWWFAFVTWRLERLAIRRLQSMSDRLLDDIGGVTRASTRVTRRSR